MPDEAAPFCVLDVETAGGRWETFPRGFELLLTGVRQGELYRLFTAHPASLAELSTFLEAFAGAVVTFNGARFDLPLLDSYCQQTLGKHLSVPVHFDIALELHRHVGYHVGLDRLALYTFGDQKLPWDHRKNRQLWETEPHRLVDYNRRDLDLTHELYLRVLRGEHLFLGDATVLLQPPS